MHRHSYKGRKLGRETDQRKALIRSLAKALIEHGSIETTVSKAKELKPFAEKLVTLAKKGGLANRRLIISRLQSVSLANKLIDDIIPKLGKRNSGFFTIQKTNLRRGDNAQLAKISFVDSLEPKKINDESSKKANEATK